MIPSQLAERGANASARGAPAAVVRTLLAAQPLASLAGCGALRAPVADDVFALWQRFEATTGERQSPPFWAVVWPGAVLMAQFLLTHPERVRGLSVLDLGCGSGMAGIAALAAGARRLIANDCDVYSVEAAKMCAELNGFSIDTSTADLSAQEGATGAEVILACELFYDGASAAALTRLLEGEGQRGVRILLADGGRAFFPQTRVVKLLTQRMPAHAQLEGVASREVSLYEWIP